MPVRPPASVLTTLEAMFGQFYIAIVVAQLVGARLSPGGTPKRPAANVIARCSRFLARPDDNV